MHSTKNLKFTNVLGAKQVYQNKNIRKKIYKTITVIWHKKTCRNTPRIDLKH